MTAAVDPRAIAQAYETHKREFATDIGAPVLAGLLCTVWLPLWFTLAWVCAYVAALHISRRAYRRWVMVGASPSVLVVSAYCGGLAVTYTLLPWAMVFHDSSAAAVIGMVMVYGGALRAVQDFGVGRWPGSMSTVPYLFPAVAPLGLSFMDQPSLESLLALVSCTSLFTYMAAVAVQQVSLRAQLLAAAEDAKAQQRAAENEKVFADQILETPLISLAVLDRDLRFKAISPRFAERMQIERATAIGQTMDEAMPWAPSTWVAAQRRSLQGERMRHEAEAYQRPDGSIGWANWESLPWRDDRGDIAGVITYGLDVTAIMEARHNAERSAELLRLALEGGQSAVYVIDLLKGKVTFDLQSERIMGRAIRFSDFDVDASDRFFEDDKPAIKDLVRQAIKGRIKVAEHRIRRAGDDATVFIRCSYSAQTNDLGQTERLVVMVTDVTAQRQRETALAAYMSEAENLLNSRRALLSDVARELELPTPATVETPRPTPIGPGEERFDAMAGQLSRLLGEIGARDAALREMITALAEARHQAEASNASKSVFLANMSHELRTPLNAIIGYSEILMEGAEEAGRGEDVSDLRRVLAAAKRLLALINEILDLSKIEAGRMELERAPFDVTAMVQSAADTVRPSAHANGNSLAVIIAPDIGDAEGDAFRLGQCLLNLLSNAAKFTKDGAVTLSARRETTGQRDWLVFDVADTGIGIPPEAQARIFKPFTQADASTTRAFGGTGLGLTITKRIIDLMGGTVELESAPGKGSRFTLRIPANPSATAAGPTQDPAQNAAAKRQGPVVLIVDPDPHAADLAARALGRLGFHSEIRAAADALVAAEVLAPALIVMDVCLDEGQAEGENLLQKLAQRPDSPVLVVSSIDDAQRLLALGACASLVKPAARERLCAAALQFARRSDAAAVENPVRNERLTAVGGR